MQRAALTTAAFTAMKLPPPVSKAKAARSPARKPARPIRRNVLHLQTLLAQGKINLPDFKLCLTLAVGDDEPQPDELFAWLVGITEADLAHRRQYLRAQGVLDFTATDEPATYVYRVCEPGAPTPPAPPSRSLSRWIVLDQGRCAHLLRADDFFASERTLCGLGACDASAHALPRLNSPPADYRLCRRCTHPRSASRNRSDLSAPLHSDEHRHPRRPAQCR